MLVVSAYFVDPKVICAGGREESDYLGDSLYIQNGASPSSVMEIPLKEKDVGKPWVNGKCVYAMGKFYPRGLSRNGSA
jgi:hypothetical protein